MAQFENATIKSACFDSIVGYDEQTGLPTYDRALTGADVREVFNMIIFDGVFDDGSFLVTDAGGGNVTVAPGHGFVHGAPVWDNASETVTLDPPDPTQARVDSIVLQFNNTLAVRRVIKVVKVGTPGSTEPPELQRDADIWELQLCTIARAPGTAAPTSITDTRDNASVCGFVTDVPAMLKDYLPLMAGQANALKGTLYGTDAQMSGDVTIEGDLDVGGGMSFSGPVGTGPLTVEGGANVSGNALIGPQLTLRNSSTQAAQAQMRSTTTTFFVSNENGGNIAFRPNGTSDSNGQMIISTDGKVSMNGGIDATGSAQIGPNLYLRSSNGANQARIRSTDSGLYVSNENSGGGSIIIRPNGTNNSSGQFIVASDGTVTFSGAVTSGGTVSVQKSGSLASVYLYDGDNIAGRVSANSTQGVYLSYQPLPQAGASGKPIYIRPNGINSSVGQLVVNADGSVATSGSIDIDGTASIDQTLFIRDTAASGTLWGRVYATSSNLILSHETGSGGVIIRPKGLSQTGTSVTVDNGANVTASGSITAGGAVTSGGNVSASKSGSFASLYLYDGSNVVGRVSSNSTQGTFITSQPATGSTTGQPIYLRPNGIGSATGQVYVDTSGVINGTNYTSVTPATGINVYRVGNLRIVRVYMDVNSVAAGSNTLSGTIASGDRPTQDTPGPASFRNGNTIIAHGSIMIGASGTVRAISSAARSATTTIEGIAVYPVA